MALGWLGQHGSGSLAARLHIWQGVWTLIAQRPLLGYGADALGSVFWRVYPAQLVYAQGRDVIVDRAHNVFLDWLVIAGAPGLLAFLLVLGTFVAVVWRALQHPDSPPQRILLTGVLAAVLGNLANTLTSFDVTPTAMATWLLMGMGVALAVPVPVGRQVIRQDAWQWALTVALFLSIGLAVWQVNMRPLGADIAARTAQIGDWPRADAAAAQAVARWPVEPAHHVLLSHSLWRLAVDEQATSPWLAEAEAALLNARDLRPGDPVIWQRLAQFYTASALRFGRDTVDLAEEAFGCALLLAPNHASLYAAWGRAALEHGDVPRAAALLRQAVALDATHGEAYLYLGAAETELGRFEIALADFREAVRLLPASDRAHTALAAAYWQLERPQAALRAVEQALRLAPQNAQAVALRHEITTALQE